MASPSLDTKVIILVRHGESVGNIHCQGLDRCFLNLLSCKWPESHHCSLGCNSIRAWCCCGSERVFKDPALTKLGVAQAEDIARQIREVDFVRKEGIELVVHSNLQRTKETCRAVFGSSQLETVESSLFREWYVDSEELLCPEHGDWNTRIDACFDWLASRPERVIAVVGHGQLFHTMLQGREPHFYNVEVRRCIFDVPTRRLQASTRLFWPRSAAVLLNQQVQKRTPEASAALLGEAPTGVGV